MGFRIAISSLALLALAACTGVSGEWVEEGATREQIRTDEKACRAQAEATRSRSTAITSDIRGSLRGGREENQRIIASTRDIDTARDHDRIIARCMLARGYTRPAG